jgi:hypothetical protein
MDGRRPGRRRRPHRRYECEAERFLAFIGIAGALVRYHRCTNWDDVSAGSAPWVST